MFRVDGVEALIRWNHPAGRLLTPGAFIPMTENSDVIVELGEWVVRAAAADLNTLTRAGIDTRVSVNISARHFCAPGFVESISDAVMETGIDPSLLELEITEEAVLSNLAATHSAIKQLQASRVRIALDDFGRGYSNLTRVADLAVDTIKIDGPLTARVTTENRVRVIVQSTIEMAQGLGCETVAEGVETLEQAACLTKIGVTHLQGYYFAKPMNFETLQDWIRSQGATQVGEMQALIAEKMKRIA
jgi:EAL domain-containing protein (putative c-di-GMP-specific phosphodiesterase class I)